MRADLLSDMRHAQPILARSGLRAAADLLAEARQAIEGLAKERDAAIAKWQEANRELHSIRGESLTAREMNNLDVDDASLKEPR